MTALTVRTAVVSLLVLGACSDPPPAVVSFRALPRESGFRFRHELPAGRIDNLPKAAMAGLAVLDVDGDGLLDLYFVNGGWHETLAGVSRPSAVAPNRLFANQGAMRWKDVTDASGTGDTGFGMGVCVGDFDNDGRTDMFVSNYGRSVLYRNRGDGGFDDVTDEAGIAPGLHAGAAFLDYDRDGLLDLFVAQYVDVEKVVMSGGHDSMPGGPPFPPPAAYAPQPAFLYRNLGDGRFEDVTQAAGVGLPGKGMAVLASDVDDDGWIDVVVANDTMANYVWRNEANGTFTNAAPTLGLAYGVDAAARGSMGVTAADVNGDGRLDFLVPDTRGGAVYLARDAWYTERSADLGFPVFTGGLVGWADAALDADLDGAIDIFKTHGDFFTLVPQPSFLLRGDGRGGFTRVGGAPDGEPRGAGRAAVAADLDDDGREDLVILMLDGRAQVLRNTTATSGNWIRLRLEGTTSNRMALGARVWGEAAGRTLVREVSGSTGYLSAGDTRVHFGLGGDTELSNVRIRWPSGETQEVGELAAGREHVIVEPR